MELFETSEEILEDRVPEKKNLEGFKSIIEDILYTKTTQSIYHFSLGVINLQL